MQVSRKGGLQPAGATKKKKRKKERKKRRKRLAFEDIMTLSPSSLMSPEGRNAMIKNIDLIKFAIITALIAVFSRLFLSAYQTKVRNDAIDGCAQSSFYQNESTDAEGRLVTVREPQKNIYEACLQFKGLTK